jgi:hypothetical protein
MLWLIGIGIVWTFSCALAVSLCVMARRGDESLAAAFAMTAESPVDVAFVATIAEPVDAVPAPPRAHQPSAP